MSSIEKFLAKPKVITLNGEELNIYPLTIADMDLVMDLEDSEKKTKAFKEMVIKTVQKAIPGTTEEQVEMMDIKYLKDITDAIIEVNDLEDESGVNIKEKITKQRELLSKKSDS